MNRGNRIHVHRETQRCAVQVQRGWPWPSLGYATTIYIRNLPGLIACVRACRLLFDAPANYRCGRRPAVSPVAPGSAPCHQPLVIKAAGVPFGQPPAKLAAVRLGTAINYRFRQLGQMKDTASRLRKVRNGADLLLALTAK